MPWVSKTLDQIRNGILRDVVNGYKKINIEVDVSPDSETYIRATATASAILGLYQYQEWIARQILEDMCDDDVLLRRAARFGMKQKDAAYASGTIRIKGQVEAPVPVGTEARRVDGVTYLTTESAVIPVGGVVDVPAQASDAGTAGNAAAGTVLTLTSAPIGIQNQATIQQMTGGAAQEEMDGLLQRLMRRMQKPPQGGADHDYVEWAEAVPGVRFGTTTIYHALRHFRSIDVVFLASGGLPSPALIEEVQRAIDAERPPTTDAVAVSPVAVPVDVAGSLVLDGVSLDVVRPLIATALAEYFDGFLPGESAVRNQIIRRVMDIDGVVDFIPSAPVANVPAPVDAAGVRICTLGNINLQVAP